MLSNILSIFRGCYTIWRWKFKYFFNEVLYSVPIVVLEFPGAYPLFLSFYCDQILAKTL